MSHTLVRPIVRTSALAAALMLGALRTAEAGPPLICHQFPTQNTESLPWKASDHQWNTAAWNSPDPAYDVRSLPADTLRLLSASAPVLARMETMRRASIYASKDPTVAGDLLVRVLGRAVNAAAEGRTDTLAFFDAGYLIESYRQAAVLKRWDHLQRKNKILSALSDTRPELNGYAWVRRALKDGSASADMELAAAMMTQGDVSRDHLSKAAHATSAESTLAAVIVRTDGQARSLSEVRARVAVRQ